MKKNLAKRFADKVDRSGDCWLWLAHKNNKGYGVMNVEGAVRLAHRISYGLFVGAIPQGTCVLHICDTPACVRPSHLKAGTQKENMQDMSLKKRGCSGSKAPWAKLNEAQVKEIRRSYSTSGLSMRAIASKYGMSYYAIYAVISKKSWK